MRGEWRQESGKTAGAGSGPTQVPSEAVTGGNDSPHILSNGERNQEDSYCLSNRLSNSLSSQEVRWAQARFPCVWHSVDSQVCMDSSSLLLAALNTAGQSPQSYRPASF